jgi:hypothetical protein
MSISPWQLKFHPIAKGHPDDTLGLSPTCRQYSLMPTLANETLWLSPEELLKKSVSALAEGFLRQLFRILPSGPVG